MLRRHDAVLLLAVCFGFSLILDRSLAAETAKPNIVVYISDDHSQFDSSLYGNPHIPTPNFERLAADGMTFSMAFVASPSCAPSRAAMLTGLMPARNGARANHTQPGSEIESLIPRLQACGYEVAAFGKVAHSNPARFGFDVIRPGRTITQLRADVTEFLTNRRSTKPLCMFVGTTNPHVPWAAESSFDPAAVDIPPIHLDTPSTREHRAAYYQEIEDLDALLGDLRHLADRHLGKNTLFIHTSDHGAQWPFGKWNLYDYGIRVPFIAAWPGVIPAGSKSQAMISWIDILPTLIDIAGGDVPGNIDGRSFADVLRGNKVEHRDVIFVTHTGDGRMNIYPIRAVRTRSWKLIHNLHPEFAHTNHSDLLRKPLAGAYWNEWAEAAKSDPQAQEILDRYYRRDEFELYHVSEDKWEQHNLIDDPAQTKRVQQMKKMLADWMAAQGDNDYVHTQPRLLDNPQDWHPDYFTPPAALSDAATKANR
ncbi:sulfatase [Thermostilla marina]